MNSNTSKLIDEYSSLVVKIINLKDYISSNEFNTLAELDRFDVQEQLSCMRDYLVVLNRRLIKICCSN